MEDARFIAQILIDMLKGRQVSYAENLNDFLKLVGMRAGVKPRLSIYNGLALGTSTGREFTTQEASKWAFLW